MRTHVGERKLQDLEYVEEMSGDFMMPDEVYNALAKLNGLEIMQVAHYIREVIKEHDAKKEREE